MKAETNKERSSRIIKELMFNLDFKSVSEFTNTIDANYMQVYYAYNGSINQLSQELIEKIMAKFPNVNEKFLRYGTHPIFTDFEKDESVVPTFVPNQVTPNDMISLLERMTSLFERIQANEEHLRKREDHVIELEKKLESLIERIEKA